MATLYHTKTQLHKNMHTQHQRTTHAVTFQIMYKFNKKKQFKNQHNNTKVATSTTGTIFIKLHINYVDVFVVVPFAYF